MKTDMIIHETRSYKRFELHEVNRQVDISRMHKKRNTMKAMLAETITSIEDIPETFNRLVQPKLNGIRAVWDPEKQTLHTRKGHEILSVPHVIEQIKECFLPLLPLDGELYAPFVPFQEVNGWAGREKADKETERLEFHVFDIALPGKSNQERIRILEQLQESSHVKMVITYKTTSKKEIRFFYETFLEEGFEGAILRSPKGFYIEGKSYNLLKIKPVRDMEAELIGFAAAREGSRNHNMFGSLILRLPNGNTFKCGGLTDEKRKELWSQRPIGANITFLYGALSNDGTPVFPRFKSLRWDV